MGHDRTLLAGSECKELVSMGSRGSLQLGGGSGDRLRSDEVGIPRAARWFSLLAAVACGGRVEDTAGDAASDAPDDATSRAPDASTLDAASDAPAAVQDGGPADAADAAAAAPDAPPDAPADAADA